MRSTMRPTRRGSSGPETFTAHFAVTFARYGFVITCSNLFGTGQPQREREREWGALFGFTTFGSNL